MPTSEKIASRLRKAVEFYHGKNGKYTELREIDLPEKSLKRVSGRDNHYT